ncbi:MAG: hypothetical protein QXF35_00910 [Candidatus Bilamarchaeaceae archaeon]
MVSSGERNIKKSDFRRDFNEFLSYIFEKAGEIYRKGKGSDRIITEQSLLDLEKIAIAQRSQRRGEIDNVVITKVPYDQMRQWVMESLSKFKGGRFILDENAIAKAMALYDFFERSQSAKELGSNLNKWVIG